MPGPHAHISDQELLNRFNTERDNLWLGILLERYTLLLFGVAMKYLKNEDEAKDAVQQVCLKAITELHKYEVQYFKSWVYMVARNYCLMKLRERQGKTAQLEEHLVPVDTDAPDKHVHIEKDRKLQLLSDSLEELSPEQKQCVTLFYLDKRSYQEIAGETGYTVMQVKSYIQNGKRNLKLLLEKKLKNA